MTKWNLQKKSREPRTKCTLKTTSYLSFEQILNVFLFFFSFSFHFIPPPVPDQPVRKCRVLRTYNIIIAAYSSLAVLHVLIIPGIHWLQCRGAEHHHNNKIIWTMLTLKIVQKNNINFTGLVINNSVELESGGAV